MSGAGSWWGILRIVGLACLPWKVEHWKKWIIYDHIRSYTCSYPSKIQEKHQCVVLPFFHRKNSRSPVERERCRWSFLTISGRPRKSGHLKNTETFLLAKGAGPWLHSKIHCVPKLPCSSSTASFIHRRPSWRRWAEAWDLQSRPKAMLEHLKGAKEAGEKLCLSKLSVDATKWFWSDAELHTSCEHKEVSPVVSYRGELWSCWKQVGKQMMSSCSAACCLARAPPGIWANLWNTFGPQTRTPACRNWVKTAASIQLCSHVEPGGPTEKLCQTIGCMNSRTCIALFWWYEFFLFFFEIPLLSS